MRNTTARPHVIAAFALLRAHPASSQCPSSRVVIRNVAVAPIAAAVYDTVTSDGLFGAGFDLGKGVVHTFQPGTLAETSAEGVDAFDVVGVAAGTPVTVTAVLTSDGTISGPCSGSGCTGVIELTLTHGADVDAIVYQRQNRSATAIPIHDQRTLTVTIVAGTPEVIAYKVLGHHAPGGGNPTTVSGALTFRGLPEGANVTSCQGYSLQAVPARRTSWGRVKTIYR